ncbi:MAG: GGDEF domain-containing protein [Gammaproteobacteria bacterium]|jgi:diguanylate cyclase (GGDEF)-like protein
MNSYNYKIDHSVDSPDGSDEKAKVAVPNLVWFYVLWSALAAISVAIGHSHIALGSALFLLGGIVSTNCFFLSVGNSRQRSPDFARLLVSYQTVMGIAWTTAYFYYSSGAGDLVLGMHMTALMFAVFYLDTWTFLKLGTASLASYVFVVTAKTLSQADAYYNLSDSTRFLVLAAIVGSCYLYSRQLRELRYQLQSRNEELQSVIDRVTKIAEEDHLTKSYNRRYIMDAINRERGVADRTGETFSILLFDIDHFKSINDRYGHLVGDQILTDFARRVKGELRGMDTVNATDHKRAFGRYGGEEFIAVLPGSDLLGAQRCAERIRVIISGHVFRENYSITVSVGVAEYQRGETVPQLLTRADQALYRAKRDGRNQVRCSERTEEITPHTVPKLRILK